MILKGACHIDTQWRRRRRRRREAAVTHLSVSRLMPVEVTRKGAPLPLLPWRHAAQVDQRLMRHLQTMRNQPGQGQRWTLPPHRRKEPCHQRMNSHLRLREQCQAAAALPQAVEVALVTVKVRAVIIALALHSPQGRSPTFPLMVTWFEDHASQTSSSLLKS